MASFDCDASDDRLFTLSLRLVAFVPARHRDRVFYAFGVDNLHADFQLRCATKGRRRRKRMRSRAIAEQPMAILMSIDRRPFDTE